MNDTRRKKGEHRFADCGGYPRCVTCGADEDDAFVAGLACSYGAKQLQEFTVIVYKEMRTEVTVVALKGSRAETIINAAFKQSDLTPIQEWEYVDDSINTDPETDINPTPRGTISANEN